MEWISPIKMPHLFPSSIPSLHLLQTIPNLCLQTIPIPLWCLSQETHSSALLAGESEKELNIEITEGYYVTTIALTPNIHGVAFIIVKTGSSMFPTKWNILVGTKTTSDVVKCNGKFIPLAVKQLVEQYKTDPKFAMVEILMMLFEACGAKYQLDVDSLDEIGVDDVVVSLVELSRNGEVEDLGLFWENFVLECQNGPLFDKLLFKKCMGYVIALSCTPPRVYRQVASSVCLPLVTSFVAKKLVCQCETTPRQLNAEKIKNDGPRVESLNKRLSLTHEMITIVAEMMRKILTGLFMHRYQDVDPDIQMSCIRSLGISILSYPSLFLQDLHLKYLCWTLNDKSLGVKKNSVLALQTLYDVDDNAPSLGLFTEQFCNRMIELADDIDTSVAVSTIVLPKQLLRHQLLSDDKLGPIYDLLIDESPIIRRAIDELVYYHLIAQNVKNSQSGSKGGDKESYEVHSGRMLQIIREFSDDPILSAYVVDDIWDDMKTMKDLKCIVSMLHDENPLIELTHVDATNLVRLLNASARKAVGEKIVPATDNKKQYYTKAQKDLNWMQPTWFDCLMLLPGKLLDRKLFLLPTIKRSIILKLKRYWIFGKNYATRGPFCRPI